MGLEGRGLPRGSGACDPQARTSRPSASLGRPALLGSQTGSPKCDCRGPGSAPPSDPATWSGSQSLGSGHSETPRVKGAGEAAPGDSLHPTGSSLPLAVGSAVPPEPRVSAQCLGAWESWGELSV